MDSSTLMEMDDDMDEDFFDRLIKDDDDDDRDVYVGTEPSAVGVDDSDEANALFNLTIRDGNHTIVDSVGKEGSEVNEGIYCGKGDVITFVDVEEHDVVDKERNSVVRCDVNEDIKVHVRHGVDKVKSFSDFFGAVCDDEDDPFSHVEAVDNPGFVSEQYSGGKDLSSSQHWDNLYPGWKYDPTTGQWQQLDGYDATATGSAEIGAKESFGQNAQSDNVVLDQNTSAYYSHQASPQCITGNVTGMLTTDSVSNWNQISRETAELPAQMVFDPQYPGWYYDMRAQEWRSVGSYTSIVNPPITVDSHIVTSSHKQENQKVHNDNGFAGFHRLSAAEQFPQPHNQTKTESCQNMKLSQSYFDNQKSVVLPQQSTYIPSEGRSSAGRPPHALVTFGFGGKLVIVRHESSFQSNSPYESQELLGSSVNILNLMEIVTGRSDALNFGLAYQDYFGALCQQSFPGPLVGGNVGTKELNKWIEDRITNCKMNYGNGEVLRLLFSLLKISCQYYGKLRSPFETDKQSKENDCPELAIAKLFASAKGIGTQSGNYGSYKQCLQNLPTGPQIQDTALEVQKLLLSGQKKLALECAQEGQLWGAALIIASQLGDQFYAETVKKMALMQFTVGSPLRTLCLLVAGDPADAFSSTTNSDGLPGYSVSAQQALQVGGDGMLDEWQENLAIMTANRTKDDELAIIHLGDCLWKQRGEVTAAHMCYLIAEANPVLELYLNGTRMCLIGADHLKFPRTYASPEAIQRTEIYEYSKVLGNSQFLLHNFQSYKLIYAHMLAEVGKVAESLKYCQAILKFLKIDRTPEVETWKQLVSALEERSRIHQQSGYSTSLAPTKLVGKLFNFFDSTAHLVVGPLPVASTSQSSVKQYEDAQQLDGSKVSNNIPTMDASSLLSSPPIESTTEWAGDSNHKTKHDSNSAKADFGRVPRKVGGYQEAKSPKTQVKVSVPGGSSRFGRFGSQIYQKTVGLVLKTQPHKQAKLGDKNKFYYDENLKRWVEEGAESPAQESAPPPPPTVFRGSISSDVIRDASELENSSPNGLQETSSLISYGSSTEIPVTPPSSNQFSARGRMSVRSRYVDTFNKGGAETRANLSQSFLLPTSKPDARGHKFFIPKPMTSSEDILQSELNTHETTVKTENPTTDLQETSILGSGMGLPSITMPRLHSEDNIVHDKSTGVLDGNNSFPQSRRVISWNGNINDAGNSSMAHLSEVEAAATHISPKMPASERLEEVL